MTLIAEGLGQKIPKGYIYSSMAFALLVEFLNIRSKKAKSIVKLHEPPLPGERAAEQTAAEQAAATH